MAEKQKNRQRPRAHKVSSRSGKGARRTHLTEVQKILICNGGMGHYYLRAGGKRLVTRPKYKGGMGAKD